MAGHCKLGEAYINLSKPVCKGLLLNLNYKIESVLSSSLKFLVLHLELGTSSGVLGPFVSTWW